MDHLKIAEIIDAYRTIPRMLLLAAYTFVAVYTWDMTEQFFMALFDENVTEWKLAAIAGFGGLTIPALAALATGLSKAYLDSGRKWNGQERRDP